MSFSFIFTAEMSIFRTLVAPGQPVQHGVGGAEERQQGVEAWLVVADVVPAHGEVGAVPRLLTTTLHQDHLVEIETKVTLGLLGPSPGCKRLLALSHLRHFEDTMLNRHNP